MSGKRVENSGFCSSFKYNRKCVVFMAPFMKWGAALGLTPDYDFVNRKISNDRFKYYQLAVLILYCAARIWCWDLATVNEDDPTHRFILTMVQALEVVLVTLIIIQGMIKKKTWVTFFAKMIAIEYEIVPTGGTTEKNPLSIPFVRCLIGFVMISVLYFANALSHFKTSGLTSAAEWAEIAVRFYTFTCITHQFYCIVNLAMSFKLKFDDINTFLRVGTVEETRKLYTKMCEIVKLFNELFGSQTVVLVCFWMLSVLYGFACIEKMHKTEEVTTAVLACGVMGLIGLTLMVLCCQVAVDASTNITLTGYDILTNLNRNHREFVELQRLVDTTVNNVIKFTAGGFFNVNKTTLLSVLNAIGAYFVVVKQFQLSTMKDA